MMKLVRFHPEAAAIVAAATPAVAGSTPAPASQSGGTGGDGAGASAPAVAPWAAPPAPAPAVPPKAGEATPPAPAIPETFEKSDLKTPEGQSVDPAAVDEIVAFSKAQGLSKQQAQAILDRDVKGKGEFLKVEQARVQEELHKQNAAWLGDLQKDKDFGGPKFGENAELAKRAMDFGDPTGEFRKELDAAGLSHYPRLVKFAAKFGALLKEDSLAVPPNVTAPKDERSLEDKLYPTMAKKQ